MPSKKIVLIMLEPPNISGITRFLFALLKQLVLATPAQRGGAAKMLV